MGVWDAPHGVTMWSQLSSGDQAHRGALDIVCIPCVMPLLLQFYKWCATAALDQQHNAPALCCRVLFLAPHKTLVSSRPTPDTTASSGTAESMLIPSQHGCDATNTASAPAMEEGARGACSTGSSSSYHGASLAERQALLPAEQCAEPGEAGGGAERDDNRRTWRAWWQQVGGWAPRLPSKQQPPAPQRMFRAVWVGPEELLAEGVLLSSHMMEDHSLLVTVPLLRQLASSGA